RFAQWLASTRPPRAFERLERLTSDAEPRVLIAACIGLGVLQSDAARESLLSLAQHPHVDRRAEALVGLAAWGPATLGRFAQDSAHEVRRLLACEAARTAGLDAALLIRELLVDRNPQVR